MEAACKQILADPFNSAAPASAALSRLCPAGTAAASEQRGRSASAADRSPGGRM